MKTFGALSKFLTEETIDGITCYYPRPGCRLVIDDHKVIMMLQQNGNGEFYLTIDDGNNGISTFAQLMEIDVFTQVEWGQ